MRSFSDLVRVALLSVVAIVVVGCATPQYADDRAAQERHRLSDPREIEKRWGLLTSLVGSSWVLDGGDGGGIARRGSWQVEGASMLVEEVKCFSNKSCRRNDFMLFWDQDTRTIALHCTWGATGAGGSKWDCSTPMVRAMALEDRSIKVVYARSFESVQKELTGWDTENTLQRNGDRIGRYWRLMSQQAAAEQVQQWRSAVAARDRESSEFWGNVGMAVVSGSQVIADAAGQRPGVSNAGSYRPPVSGTTPSHAYSSSEARQTQASQGAARPLRFFLRVGMQVGPKATQNPSCWSEIIEVPAPAGFGAGPGGRTDSDAARQQALRIMESHYEAFRAACARVSDGQLMKQPEGMVIWRGWNADSEKDLQDQFRAIRRSPSQLFVRM